MKVIINILLGGLVCLLTSCTSVKISLFTGKSEKLKEYRLSGNTKESILIIPVEGMISNSGEFSLFSEHPGMLENIKSQLESAEHNNSIKGVVLKINSPGGLVTASDILYNEIMNFKKKTGKKIVVSMMDLATSGAYMIALSGDIITAHPTTVTGSVGVIFLRPQFSGLMHKLGLGVDVTKSGINKDMGSPFRKSTEEENKLFQDVIDKLDNRFLSLVQRHRSLTPENLKLVRTARIFIAKDAVKIGLIDKICYLDGALAECRKRAKLSKNTRVIVYRRNRYPNDNLYNTTTSVSAHGASTSLIDVGIFNSLGAAKSGFYAIWAPALGTTN
jgi:protease-4